MNSLGNLFKVVVLVLVLVEVQNVRALCPPICPTTVKDQTTEANDPTTSPGYTTVSMNPNGLQCFTCDSFQSSLEECGEEQEGETSSCPNGKWCFVNVVHSGACPAEGDVISYERGCWEESLCDNAAKNTGDDLDNQSCSQQNGTCVCHSCCNKDQCNGKNLAASLNFETFAVMIPILNIILSFP